MIVPVIIPPVHADAFRENKFQPGFSDTFAEIHQFAGITGKGRGKFQHPVKVLVISILTPLFHHGLIRKIAYMFQDKKTAHQPDRFGLSAHICTVKRRKGNLKSIPDNLMAKAVQGMLLVQLVGKRTEQGEGGSAFVYHKICKFENVKILNLADFTKNTL